jgi:hypothetical protein
VGIRAGNENESFDCIYIATMILSKAEIDNNIAWLVQNASSSVRYLTYCHLLKMDTNSVDARRLWGDVQKDKDVREIFAKQKADGSWCAGGPWASPPSYIPKGGCTPVSPKYVTATWILWILGDAGFNMQDKSIRKACDYVLAFQCRNGFIPETDKDKYEVDVQILENMPCRFSLMLIGLGKVGAFCDTRLASSYKLLVRWQREDGGWILQKHKEERNWHRSCPYSTFHATYALHVANNERYKEPIRKGLMFLLHHLSQKEGSEIKKFFYHGHSIIHELLMFSEFGIGLDTKPVRTILEWLSEMYDAREGCFAYNGKPIAKYSRRKDGMDARVAKYRLYHLIETDWFTYYMTRISQNMI